METVPVTEKTFEATVKQGIVLLDFWASWCGRAVRSRLPSRPPQPATPTSCSARFDTEAEPGLARW